jgi:hypothetical protein
VLVLGVLALSTVLLMLYQPRMWALLPCQFLLGWLALRANGWAIRKACGVSKWMPKAACSGCKVTRPLKWLCDDCFVSPLFVIVNVTAAGRRHSCLLLPDSADQEALRQLRVYLLWFHRKKSRTPLLFWKIHDAKNKLNEWLQWLEGLHVTTIDMGLERYAKCGLPCRYNPLSGHHGGRDQWQGFGLCHAFHHVSACRFQWVVIPRRTSSTITSGWRLICNR